MGSFFCEFRPFKTTGEQVMYSQAITRSRAANSKKEVDTKANQRPTTKTSECVFHRKYF